MKPIITIFNYEKYTVLMYNFIGNTYSVFFCGEKCSEPISEMQKGTGFLGYYDVIFNQ